MNLRYYEQRIRPEHWEEFQQLLPEEFRAENNDFTVVKKQMAISAEKLMAIRFAWEHAAETITEKYEYDDFDEGEDE